jgi:hypothetical protein
MATTSKVMVYLSTVCFFPALPSKRTAGVPLLLDALYLRR